MFNVNTFYDYCNNYYDYLCHICAAIDTGAQTRENKGQNRIVKQYQDYQEREK